MNQTRITSHASWPLGVQFDAASDRRAHRVFVRDGHRTLMLAESIEGHDREDWPCSPVLQQVDRCELSDRRQGVVGLGLGGTSHWSMAIESDQHEGLIFDVACRVNTRPRFLGSTYGTDYPFAAIDDTYAELTVDGPQGRRIGFEVLQGRLHLPSTEGRLAVVPEPLSGSFPATIRWRYRLFLVPPSKPSKPTTQK